MNNTNEATLLEMYESYHNGQKKQFITQVKQYGYEYFINDIKTELKDGVLNESEIIGMLSTIILIGIDDNS